jgi:Bacterial Ig domain/Bacterial cadherin-like domain
MLKFTIDTNTGALSFLSAPDFETPTDADTDNVYVVEVTGNDGTNNAVQSISVTVQNGNELPTFTSTATPNVPENQTAVITVTTNDVDGDTVTYSITGGDDALDFSIDTNSGALSFNVAPNFEAPHDADTNNIYLVEVTADDGPNAAVQNLTVTVTAVNEAPIYSSGATYTQDENISAVTTVVATDPEAVAVTYSITGGADAGDFTIDTNTGALSFTVAPDFDAPADADANNEYLVEVTATDGANPVMQAIDVTITNVEEGPAFTSSATPSVAENMTTAVDVDATDPEGQAVTYSIVGGADAADFSIDTNTGVLTFLIAPNFEAPHDADTNNIYLVNVEADDATSTAIQNLSITVTNVDEAPSITSANTANTAENTTTVIDVDATDPDAGAVLTYSIAGGADQLKFSIVAGTGVLTFQSAPDFENPTDAGGDNVYDVDVEVTDGTNPVTQAIAVTVTNVDEAPSFSSANTANVAENNTAVIDVDATDPEGLAVTYSISGGADQALFSIVPATGVLTFLSAPNFEAPADAGANNVYDVQVQASAGAVPGTQNIAVTVTNVNEAPVITITDNAIDTLEDTNITMNGGAGSTLASIADPDGDVTIQVTLTATQGTLSLNGVAGLTFIPANAANDGVDDTNLVFTGTVSVVNARLNGMVYKPNLNYFGNADVDVSVSDLGNTGSGGTQTDGPDNIDITVIPVNDAPVAEPKTHATHSAIGLTINGATHTGELKENATDVDDPASELTVQLAGTVSPANLVVTLNDPADGSFKVDPPGGFTGAATFQYQVCDDNAGDPNQCSAVTTVTLNVSGQQTWFVDDAAGCLATCNGSVARPLIGLATVPNVATRGTGDAIFVSTGTYPTAFTMAASERFIGQGSSGIQAALNHNYAAFTNGTLDALPPTGTHPTLQNTLTAAASTLVRGITLNTVGNKGYVGTGASQSVFESSVTANNTAVELTGATTSNINFTSTTSTAGTHGINLSNVSGTFNFGTGGPLVTDGLKNHTVAGFLLVNAGAGTNATNIDYSGVIQPGAGGRAVLIGTNNNLASNASNGLEGGTVNLTGNITGGGIGVYESTGGTLNLSGNLTFNTGTTNAVELVDNHNGTGGATINFSSGNLAITTTTGKGFHSSLGGTINVTGANNTIVSGNGLGSGSTGGVALEVAGTASELISPANTNYTQGGSYTFRSINASFGVNGVSVNVHQGGLTVTGTGGAGTGGTINTMTNRGYELINVRGAVALSNVNVTNGGTTNGVAAGTCGEPVTGDNTLCAAGIHANTLPTSFALNTITVTGGNQIGINTRTVNNLTMSNIEVSNVGNEAEESGVLLVNTSGSGSITNANLHDNEARQLHMYNGTGTLSSFPITASTFANSVSPNGQQGVLIETYNAGTNMNVTVGSLAAGLGNTFSALRGNAWQLAASNSASLTAHLLGSSVTNTNGIVAQASLGATVTTNIESNTFVAGANTTAGVISLKTDGNVGTGANMNASVISNTIGNGAAGSGTACANCNGMFINPRFGGTSTFTVRGNTIQNINGAGIDMTAGETGTQDVEVFITGNVIQDPGAHAAANRTALSVTNGVSSGPPNDAGCLALTLGGSGTNVGVSTATNARNIINDSWSTAAAGTEIFLWQRFGTTYKLAGYPGTGIPAYVGTQNTGSPAPNASSLGTISGGASCP